MRALGVMLGAAMVLLIVYSLSGALSSRVFLPGERAERVHAPAIPDRPRPTPALTAPAATLRPQPSVRLPAQALPSDPERVKALADGIQTALTRVDDWVALEKVRVARDADVCLRRADQLLAAGDLPGALAACKRAAELAPRNLNAQLGLAHVLGMMERYEEAAETYETALCVAPNHVPALFNLGVTRVRLGEIGAAEDAFRRALEIDPDHGKSIYNLATLAQAEGKLGEARRLWTRLVALGGPKRHEALVQAGRLALALGDADAAVETLSMAALERPADTASLNALGEALSATHQGTRIDGDDGMSPIGWWLFSLAVDPNQPTVAVRIRARTDGPT